MTGVQTCALPIWRKFIKRVCLQHSKFNAKFDLLGQIICLSNDGARNGAKNCEIFRSYKSVLTSLTNNCDYENI